MTKKKKMVLQLIEGESLCLMPRESSSVFVLELLGRDNASIAIPRLEPSVGQEQALHKHLKRCKARKAALRVVDQLSTTIMSPDGVTLRDWRFDPKVSRKELARMIVLHELPFAVVEYDGSESLSPV